MYQYQHVLHRMRLGDSDRQIQKAGLMGRRKAATVRQKAREQGWLDPACPIPQEADLQATFGSHGSQKSLAGPPLAEWGTQGQANPALEPSV